MRTTRMRDDEDEDEDEDDDDDDDDDEYNEDKMRTMRMMNMMMAMMICHYVDYGEELFVRFRVVRCRYPLFNSNHYPLVI